MKTNPPSRFAFISTMSLHPWGGSEELWSRGALRLQAEGHAVAAGVPFWPVRPSPVREMWARGIEMHHWHRSGPSIWEKVRARAAGKYQWNWLRRFAPDLVVVSQGGVLDQPDCLRFCRVAGLPYAVIIQANAEWWWPADDQIDEMRENLAAARKIFCVSHHNLRVLRMELGLDLPQAEVVWNPTNLLRGEPAPWPAEEGSWKWACVARLEPMAKGQDVLFETVALPKWRARRVEVNLYGTGRSERSLRRLAEYLHLENVRFHGQVHDVAAIWAENHLLVLPSRAEGLPLALVEAMWCERPAVVSAVGGNAELCLEGETGFVAAAPTVELFDQALERAWQRRADWPLLGKAARARVTKLVPPDAVGELVEKLRRIVD